MWKRTEEGWRKDRRRWEKRGTRHLEGDAQLLREEREGKWQVLYEEGALLPSKAGSCICRSRDSIRLLPYAPSFPFLPAHPYHANQLGRLVTRARPRSSTSARDTSFRAAAWRERSRWKGHSRSLVCEKGSHDSRVTSVLLLVKGTLDLVW